MFSNLVSVKALPEKIKFASPKNSGYSLRDAVE